MVTKVGKISVAGTKIGVIVTGANAAYIRRALNLLKKKKRKGQDNNGETKIAMKFYNISKRFFASGGRFKRPYKHNKLKKRI